MDLDFQWKRGRDPDAFQETLDQFVDTLASELEKAIDRLMGDVIGTVQKRVKHPINDRSKIVACVLQLMMGYKDPETLRELYHDKQLTYEEIGDKFGVGLSTIQYWMDKHDVDRRTSAESRDVRGTEHTPTKSGPHTDEEWLREKYYDEHRSVGEMAELADVSDATIIRNMDKHGLERRPAYVTRVLRNPGAGFVQCDANGYETIKHSVDDHTYNFKIHRLIAIAQWGYDAVRDGVVHHKNGLTWDNRPENLELLESQAKHATIHHDRREIDDHGRLT